MPQVCALLDNDTYELLADEAKKRDVKRGRALALITKEYFAPDSREHDMEMRDCWTTIMNFEQNMLRKEKDLSKLQNNLALKEEIIKLRDMQIDELQTNLNYLRHENSVLVAQDSACRASCETTTYEDTGEIETTVSGKRVNGEKKEVTMKISKVRRNLYRSARLLGDLKAVQKGTVGKRIVRRTAGRYVSRMLWRGFK